jgi:hypothetical protein
LAGLWRLENPEAITSSLTPVLMRTPHYDVGRLPVSVTIRRDPDAERWVNLVEVLMGVRL